MSQTTTRETESNATVETIQDANVWEAVVDGINAIGHDEGVFEFGPDGFRVGVKDPANVALISQTIDADDFDHFDVTGTFSSGVSGQTFDDLLSAIGKTDPVEFKWDWEVFKWAFRSDDIAYDMSGIDASTVNGSPVDVPPVKDELPYTVDVTLPVDKWERATKIVGMNTQIATFRMGGPDEIFVVEGQGDTDDARIALHESDLFEWREDPPTDEVVCRQSNQYMSDIVGLLDEDTARLVTGPEVPYHLWTTREGVIDTKIIQAPRVDTS